MISNRDFIRYSLETNLFFLRIMKEHTIFAAASFPPKGATLSQQAITLKNNIEKLLSRAIALSQGVISSQVFSSGELVTDLTLQAEKATETLTGIPINSELTKRELQLKPAEAPKESPKLIKEVSSLNLAIIAAVNAAISFQTNVYKEVLNCRAFSYMYSTMIHHITEEAKFYVMLLDKLQKRESLDSIKEVIQVEITWNDIMGEHAEFIRGLLDPSERQLFEKANTFVKQFDELKKATNSLPNQTIRLPEVTRESLKQVTDLRNFKRQSTEGLLACKIRALISPLLSDHVTREANHYLRLLKDLSTLQNV